MIEKLTFGLFTQEDSRSFMRLMAYIRPYKVRIIFALIAIFGVAATESYLAAFICTLGQPRLRPAFRAARTQYSRRHRRHAAKLERPIYLPDLGYAQ